MTKHEELAKRVGDLATQIVKQIKEAGRSSLEYSGGKLYLRGYRTNACNGALAFHGLFFEAGYEGNEGDLKSGEVGDGERGRYIHGDFHAWQQYPILDELHQFVADWPEIKKAIDNLEDSQLSRSAEGLKNLPESI